MLAPGIAACDDSENHYIDPRPRSDIQREPNSDTNGDYTGCHGITCVVNDPG